MAEDDDDDVFHDSEAPDGGADAAETAPPGDGGDGGAAGDGGAVGGDEPWRADGIAAADEAFEMLLACEAPHAFWEHAGYEQGVEVQRVAWGHSAIARFGWLGEGYALFRACTDFEGVEPTKIFDTLHNWTDRPSWDSTLAEMTHLLDLMPRTPARHYAFMQQKTRPIAGGLVGRREFCFVMAHRHEAVGTPAEQHLTICRWHEGCEAALAPEPPRGHVRAHVFIGAMVLRPLPGGAAAGTRVVLLTCAAPRGAIPRVAANIGGVRSAALLSELRRHLIATGALKA